MAKRDTPEDINKRAARDSETLLSSSMKRTADHLAGADAPPDDPIEKWGRRVGRTLGVIVAIYLAFQLYLLLSGQRG
jgi:hypothetical protein